MTGVFWPPRQGIEHPLMPLKTALVFAKAISTRSCTPLQPARSRQADPISGAQMM